MRRKYTAMAVVTGVAALLLGAAPATALEKCAAKIKAKDGTILVSAQDVIGPLSWGWSDTTRIQPFFNAATCLKSGKAKKCTQGEAGTLLAMVPPPDCTLYLADGAGTCTVSIKTCTPGERPLVEFPTRFIDNGDNTVTDTRTGLMWEKKANSGFRNVSNTYTWSSTGSHKPDGTAFFFLAWPNYYYGGGGGLPYYDGDWRLPTLAELRTIVDLTQGNCGGGSGPCIDQAVFGPTVAGQYWSDVTEAGVPGNARYLSFFSGLDFAKSKTDTASVRAVRRAW